MCCFDDPAIIIEPDLMLGASGLSEASRKIDDIHRIDLKKRFQKGSEDSESLPAFSKTFSCSSHASLVTGG